MGIPPRPQRNRWFGETDPHITPENRRYGQLAWLLRAHTLVDVDCWTRVPGEPLRPGRLLEVMRAHAGPVRDQWLAGLRGLLPTPMPWCRPSSSPSS